MWVYLAELSAPKTTLALSGLERPIRASSSVGDGVYSRGPSTVSRRRISGSQPRKKSHRHTSGSPAGGRWAAALNGFLQADAWFPSEQVLSLVFDMERGSLAAHGAERSLVLERFFGTGPACEEHDLDEKSSAWTSGRRTNPRRIYDECRALLETLLFFLCLCFQTETEDRLSNRLRPGFEDLLKGLKFGDCL